MDEQALLKQIAGMLEAQSAALVTRMDERFAAIDEKFTAMDGKFAAMDGKFTAMDGKFTAIDGKFAAIDGKFAALDEKFSALTDHVTDIVHEIGKRMDQQKAEIIQEVRVLAENIEGDKIRILAEESGAHRDTLADHEERIENLEELVSAG